MEKKSQNEKFQKALSKCVKCGACQAVCPVYDIEKKENSVARGKLALLQAYMKGEIELTSKLYETISKCILCTSCKDTCAASIEIDRIISTAREKAVKEFGMPPLKKALLEILCGTFPGRKTFLKSASLVEKMFMKKIPSESGLFYKGYFLGRKEGKIFPALSKKTLTEIIDLEKVSDSLSSVLFFQGCTINFISPQTGISALNLIRKSNFTPILLNKQQCCGLPAFFSGDREKAEKLAYSNLEMLSEKKFDYLVVACATCGSAFKEIYPLIFEDDSNRLQKWEEIKGKILDLSEFLSGPGNRIFSKIKKTEKETTKTATYHDPCHLYKGQKIEKEPREIIKNIPRINLVEMENSSDCCGFGGMFSIENFELSREINKKKIENILSSKAELVLTGCPGCILQIKSGLIAKSSNIEVKHWCELLDEATNGKSTID
ncbi:MAG: (Fe-S)-binding protein [Candidatus Schekmanbacteria bacterium]|nr:MAG: (Fe-S)-binding protein [Candidatus Schekmanbacteria bacterium]